FTITIQWTQPGTYQLEYDFYDMNNEHYYAQLNVTVAPSGPSSPVAISAASITATSFTARWNSVAGATSYRLDVSTNGSFPSFVSGYNNLSVTSTSRSITGLSSGITYYYRVRAVNASGVSLNSNVIAVTTTA